MPRLRFLAIAVAATALVGCKTLDTFATGSLGGGGATVATTQAGWRAVADNWRPRYERDASDARAASIYGRALRQLGQRTQALAVLQTAMIKNPQDRALLGEYGRALADNGQFEQALDVLSRAHTPDRPDWRILMVQGVVLDQMGRGPEARDYYKTALKIAPGEPALLSNLGLSYALDDDLANADTILRQANAAPNATGQVRQNLALVLTLEGKFDEAQTVSGRDLSPEAAAQNVAYIRSMIAQGNTWQRIKQADVKAKSAG